LESIIPDLASDRLKGLEIAPTAIWSNLNKLTDEEVLEFKNYLKSHNLVVSGIQSLLYGHLELQLFNQSSWSELEIHLKNILRIGGLLGADVAVFGSPKNRIKGSLQPNEAHNLAAIFLTRLIPYLMEYGITLTLEPNAPAYGADYLTTYEEVLRLTALINSSYIKPQIDTGCLWMVNKSPEDAYTLQIPHHIHLSTPNLGEVPGKFKFDKLIELLVASNYNKWVVIEMLPHLTNSLNQITNSIGWLTDYEEKEKNG
jgi:sugar phosphate isomerase/epimerase